ncbi:MAG TPA: hypothetical protein PKD75_05535 [Tepidiformaceae bacterium]|nr:hypothetical protein [Tepidiformaceae bacterium]
MNLLAVVAIRTGNRVEQWFGTRGRRLIRLANCPSHDYLADVIHHHK